MARTVTGQTALIVFGRFNPPTTETADLIRYMALEAENRNAVAFVFPSPSSPKDDEPFAFRKKVDWLRTFHPNVVVNGNAKIRTPYDAVHALGLKGFTDVAFVVAPADVSDFTRLTRNLRRHRFPDVRGRLSIQDVIVAPESKKSELTEAAREIDFFRGKRWIPTKNPRLAKQFFEDVRQHLRQKRA